MARYKGREQQYNKQYHHAIRMAALAALGGECAVCGYDDDRALHIDHVAGDGKVDRKNKISPRAIYRECAAGTAVGKYQLLCANCHDIKSHTNGERGRPRKQLQADSDTKK